MKNNNELTNTLDFIRPDLLRCSFTFWNEPWMFYLIREYKKLVFALFIVPTIMSTAYWVWPEQTTYFMATCFKIWLQVQNTPATRLTSLCCVCARRLCQSLSHSSTWTKGIHYAFETVRLGLGSQVRSGHKHIRRKFNMDSLNFSKEEK